MAFKHLHCKSSYNSPLLITYALASFIISRDTAQECIHSKETEFQPTDREDNYRYGAARLSINILTTAGRMIDENLLSREMSIRWGRITLCFFSEKAALWYCRTAASADSLQFCWFFFKLSFSELYVSEHFFYHSLDLLIIFTFSFLVWILIKFFLMSWQHSSQ